MWPCYFCVLLFRIVVSLSLQNFPLVEDYAKEVKGFNAITVLSCPLKFHIESWITATTNRDYLFQFLDMTKGCNLTEKDDEMNCRQLIVIDLECPGISRIIIEWSQQGQFNSLCRDFLLLDSREETEEDIWYKEELEPLLSTVNFTFISNVALGTKYPISKHMEDRNESSPEATELYIYDVWNPGRIQGGTLKMDLIGIYKSNATNGIQYHKVDDRIMVQRRLDLSELQLHCAIVITSPFNDTLESYITHNYDPYLDTVHRLNFRTIGLVQDYLNFKLNVKRVKSWGYLQNASSTTFDGMVGMVQRREVDFGCSPAWFRVERLEVVDYGAQTWSIRPLFLFRHPNTRGLGKNVFLSPFEDHVWVVMLISSVVIILLMTNAIQQDKSVLGKITQEERIAKKNKDKGSSILIHVQHAFKSFVQSTRIYLSVILQQG